MPAGYRQLLAWQKAMALVVDIYALTRVFPTDERFGLTSQMRRAAVSVPSNIAEGHGRGTKAEFQHFLRTARGSLVELETQLLIAQSLDFTDLEITNRLTGQTEEVARMITGLINSADKSF